MSQVYFLLKQAKQRFSHSQTPQLDAELLLMHVLGVDRSYLHTWPEQELSPQQIQTFYQLCARRELGEPIAYLIGYKDFWSLRLTVNNQVLIPRPETELLVEIVLQQLPTSRQQRVADLGTGSGAIALAVAYECRDWEIWACDKSIPALEVARKNADALKIPNVIFCLSDWCDQLPKHAFHAIITNPPYIAEGDAHLQNGDIRFEPKSALVAENKGLSDIQKIIEQAKGCLLPNGLLLIEHGYNQAVGVRKLFSLAGYTGIVSHKDYAGCDRAVTGFWQS